MEIEEKNINNINNNLNKQRISDLTKDTSKKILNNEIFFYLI